MQHRQDCVLMACWCNSMQFDGHEATGVLEPGDALVQGVGDAHIWLLPPPRHARQQVRPRKHQHRGVRMREEHGCHWLCVWIRLVEHLNCRLLLYILIRLYIYMCDIFGNGNPLLGGDTLSVACLESSDTLAWPLPTLRIVRDLCILRQIRDCLLFGIAYSEKSKWLLQVQLRIAYCVLDSRLWMELRIAYCVLRIASSR